MREATKVLCVVVFMAAAPVGAIAWTDDRPNETVTLLKYACPILAVLAIAGFLKIHFRADDAPDYLRQRYKKYFNRGGFCFAFQPREEDGVCYLDIYFQNQQSESCEGRVALRPARGFFLGRAKMDTIVIAIHCAPAAFGVAKIPIPVPQTLQGKRQSFEVGASVHYSNGKGRTLRFGDGITLRANSNFQNALGTALTVAAALTGDIVLSSPATATLQLPTGVAEEVPDNVPPQVTTFWELGNPPLEATLPTA